MTVEHTGTCLSCPARVIWCVSERGNTMPVDLEAAPTGNLAIEYRGAAPPRARVVRRDPAAPRDDLHLAHFVTCPQAGAWRKKKGPKR